MTTAAASPTNRKGTTMTAASMTRPHAPVLRDEQEYRLLFAATFVVFLAAALVMRIVRSFNGRRSAGAATSLFAEAKSTGYSALAFAFMG